MNFMRVLFGCVFFLAVTVEAANFFSLYDFAHTYSDNEASDLIGKAPTLKIMAFYGKAATVSKSSDWQTKEGRALYVDIPSSATSFSIISSVSLSSLQTTGIFLAATQENVSGTPGCAVNCSLTNGILSICMYCSNGEEIQEEQKTLHLGNPNVISFGFSGFNSSGSTGINLYIQPSDGKVEQYFFLSEKLSFKEFWKNSLKLTMAMNGAGSVYYLGFISHEIQTIEFSELSAGSNPDTKEITCFNCQGPASGLTCANKKTLRVGTAVREYFCECEDSFAFQESVSSCVSISEDTKNPNCTKGHSSVNNSLCYSDCQNSNIANYDGEFVSCSSEKSIQERRPRYKIEAGSAQISKQLQGLTMRSAKDPYSSNYYKDNSYPPSDHRNSYDDDGTNSTGSTSTFGNTTKVVIIVILSILGILGLIVAIIVCIRCGLCCKKTNDKTSPHVPQELHNVNIESKDEIHPGMECRICARSGLQIVVIAPCGHSGVCIECIQQLQTCPFDRTQITGFVVPPQS